MPLTLTPAGWGFDQIVMLGVLWMFGSPVPMGLLAAVVGRWAGSSRSLGVALLLWSLGNLAVAALAGAYLRMDTVRLTLLPTRCEAAHQGQEPAAHNLVFALQRPGEPPHDLVLGRLPGDCPAKLVPETMRVRRDALASPARLVVPEAPIDGDPLVIVLVWGGFGLFGLMFAGATLAQAAGAPQAPVVAAWRGGVGRLLGQLGGLLLLAAVVVPFLLPGSALRGVQFGLRAAAAAMACFIVANALVGTLGVRRGLLLLLAGAALLGMAELLRAGV